MRCVSSPMPASPLALPGSFRAVVCDMDGLLVHTERQWLEAKRVLFARYGATLERVDRSTVFGASDIETVSYFAGRLGVPRADIPALRIEYMDIVGGLMDRGVEVTDGAVELLSRLRGRVPLGLASNTRRPLVERILRQTPFADWFDAITTGDEATPKPAPDLYRLACERLGIEPRTAVALEDSPAGVQAARRAGLTCIGVPSDAEHPLTEADHLVSSLTQLL
jgi:HAD superfamily hydrolase (TIGR01509 family)